MSVTDLVLIVLAGPTLLLVPAWLYSRRNGESSLFLFFFWPAVLFWFLLVLAGYGPQSLANLVELPFIAVAAVLCGYLKVFLVDLKFESPRKSTIGVTGILLLVTVALRTFMPLLPE